MPVKIMDKTEKITKASAEFMESFTEINFSRPQQMHLVMCQHPTVMSSLPTLPPPEPKAIYPFFI